MSCKAWLRLYLCEASPRAARLRRALLGCASNQQRIFQSALALLAQSCGQQLKSHFLAGAFFQSALALFASKITFPGRGLVSVCSRIFSVRWAFLRPLMRVRLRLTPPASAPPRRGPAAVFFQSQMYFFSRVCFFSVLHVFSSRAYIFSRACFFQSRMFFSVANVFFLGRRIILHAVLN
jgi:hypothetical protein